MSKEKCWRILGDRNVYERGGSLAVNIPSKVVKYLKLNVNDRLLFILDTETEHVMIGTEKNFGKGTLEGHPIRLYTPITVKELEELMEKEKR